MNYIFHAFSIDFLFTPFFLIFSSKSTTGASKVCSEQNEENKQESGRVRAGEINDTNAMPSVSVSVASGSRHFTRVRNLSALI